MICPLCKNNSILLLENVKKNDIVDQYNQMLKDDFSYLFFSDLKYLQCNQCKLKFFDPLVTGDEKFYNSLQQFDWYYLDDKSEYSLATKFIKKSDSVLEIGSGKGAFAKKINANTYTGLDFSIEAKKMAAENGITIYNETIEEHSEKNIKYDVVVSFQVLEHVSDPNQFIKKSLNCLKDNGLMIIAVPSEDSFLQNAHNNILNMPPHHVTRWSDKALKFISSAYDLELLTIDHEEVQPIHKDWFKQTYITSSIFKKLKFRPALFRNSRFERKIIQHQSKLAKLLRINYDDTKMYNGHTVVAVYKKK